MDGNKRIGFLVSMLFLGLNGYRFAADEADAAASMFALAAGDASQADFSEWLKANSGHLDS